MLYAAELARVRDLIAQFGGRATNEIDSTELKLRTLAAARAGYGAGVPFAALCADLGRVASEELARDQLTALTVSRAMARWSAPVYYITEPLL